MFYHRTNDVGQVFQEAGPDQEICVQEAYSGCPQGVRLGAGRGAGQTDRQRSWAVLLL